MAAKKKPNGNAAPKKPRPAVPAFEFGRSLEDAMTCFSPEVIFHCYVVGARQQWAEHLRQLAGEHGPLSDAEIDAQRAAWKPTVRMRGDAPAEKASKIVGKLSPEEKQALLEALKA